MSHLSAEQKSVMALVAVGKRDPVIAEELGITLSAVESRLAHVYMKYGINGDTQWNRRVKAVIVYLDVVARQEEIWKRRNIYAVTIGCDAPSES